MKLKTLSIVAAVLAAASIATWLFNRGGDRVSTDPRVGQPLVSAETVAQIASVRLKTEGKDITISNTESSGSNWIVKEYHELPADFSKLTRLITDLREARVLRFVSANPERLERMEFGDTKIELRGKDDTVLWSADLGKTTSGGGRFIRFGDDPRAYLTGLSTWIDSTTKNWANAALIAVKPEDVTALELGFPEGVPLKLTRESGEASWKVEGLAEDEQLKESPVTSLLSTLTNLRFTETEARDAENVTAAREHARTVKLTTKENKTYSILLGRKPAPPAPPPPPPPAEGETAPPAPPEPQPGPVFAFVSSSVSTDPINAMMDKRAFQVGDWSFTGLPANREALIEKTPPPAPAPAAEETSSADETTDDGTPKPTSFPDEAAETAHIAKAYADYRLGPEGIRYKVLKEGSGDKPSQGAQVKAHYAGRLLDGKEFDSSYQRNEPFAFELGRGQVIEGWDLIIADMVKGEKRRVVIPSQLGYGERGAGSDIPARATLVFEIELVDF